MKQRNEYMILHYLKKAGKKKMKKKNTYNNNLADMQHTYLSLLNPITVPMLFLDMSLSSDNRSTNRQMKFKMGEVQKNLKKEEVPKNY